MEEHAQFNARKISKADFLKVISSPFRHAFTPENIKKSFEKTGTWPINRTKITSDMVGPSVGLSGKSAPIVVLNSPLKRVVELLENYSINSPQSQLSTTQSQCPSPASQTSSLPNDSAPAPSSTSSISNLSGFEDTRAAFLFDGSPPSSSNAIPPINFHPPNSSVLSDASYKRLDAAQMTTMTKSALIAQIQNLEKDIGLLIDHSQEMKELVYPLTAQAALLGLENKNLWEGLSLREKKRISSQERLFPGGTGSLATGDAFMDEQALIDREREQTKAKSQLHKQNSLLGKNCGPGQRWNGRKGVRLLLLQVDSKEKWVTHHFYMTSSWTTVQFHQPHYPVLLKLCRTHKRGKVDNVGHQLTHWSARKSIWGIWKVMRALKHGQCTMRVMDNEKEHTVDLELTIFVVPGMRGSLGGT